MAAVDISNGKPVASGARKILVVDDDAVILKTLSLSLEYLGYRVLTAANVIAALTAVRQEKPDLILMDLHFPAEANNVSAGLQDGLQVIDWLRHMNGEWKTPVMIISATDPEQYKERARAAGVTACFAKPIDTSRLVAATNAVLAGGGHGGSSGQLAVDSGR